MEMSRKTKAEEMFQVGDVWKDMTTRNNELHLDHKTKIATKGIIRKIYKIKSWARKNNGIFTNNWERFDMSLEIMWIELNVILQTI